MTKAYPLAWPRHFPRTKEREKGKFQTTLAGALKNVEKSLQMFANDSDKTLHNLVISSNVTLGVMRPEDPGVSVWFTWDELQVCIPVDRYSSVEGNLQAIHHIIEARRVELRHGSLALIKASFQGFLALPAPTGRRDWWVVLGVPKNSTEKTIQERHRHLRSLHHPDKPDGDGKLMAEINTARDDALKEIQP